MKKEPNSKTAVQGGKNLASRANPIFEDSEKVSRLSVSGVYQAYRTSEQGLTDEQASESIDINGTNEVVRHKDSNWFTRLFKAFASPFTIMFLVVAGISVALHFIPGDDSATDSLWWITPLIIVLIVILSGVIRFVEEGKSQRSTDALKRLTENTSTVYRNGKETELPNSALALGDKIHLGAGDMLPADVRIVKARDFFVNQMALTGESVDVEKKAEPMGDQIPAGMFDFSNVAFQGSSVTSGTAEAVIVRIGVKTVYGNLVSKVASKRTKTAFDRGIDSVTKLLMAFMCVMVPLVFLFRGLAISDLTLGGNWMRDITSLSHWLDTLTFAVSVAVGLTPALLPVQVASDLAKGAVAMSKKKVIVKDINSIQNFGAMDVLCTDKTGTLTEGNSTVSEFINAAGVSDDTVMELAYLNSLYQTGIRNQLDKSVVEYMDTKPDDVARLQARFTRLDEIPFDFNRKMLTILVHDNQTGDNIMITKGFPGTVKEKLAYVNGADDRLSPLTREGVLAIRDTAETYGALGTRVILVAAKKVSKDAISLDDEKDLVFMGFLTFKDTPKLSAAGALAKLRQYGVRVKVLTGDALASSLALCAETGFGKVKAISGPKMAQMDDAEFQKAVEECDLFVKLSPDDKERIVKALKANKHTVGFMGDGINDAAALKAADVGISFRDATDIAKEAADMILLENDLDVLFDGILEGRRAYNNMMKYTKGQTSSNFGNMISQLAGSIWIPFLPMQAVQIILLDIISDVSCATMPLDRVDDELLLKPCRFSVKEIRWFMFLFGPLSSVVDLCAFALLMYVIAPNAIVNGQPLGLFNPDWSPLSYQYLSFMAIFETGFFIESLVTQNVVYAFLRTEKLPLIQSRPSTAFGFAILLSILLGFFVIYVPGVQGIFQFAEFPSDSNPNTVELPPIFLPMLLGLLTVYVGATEPMKRIYRHRFGRLL